MILQINRYHKTSAGEVATSETIKGTDEIALHREAQKKAYLYASNYSADNSIVDWEVSIVNPRTMHIVKHLEYFTPDAPVEAQPS